MSGRLNAKEMLVCEGYERGCVLFGLGVAALVKMDSVSIGNTEEMVDGFGAEEGDARSFGVRPDIGCAFCPKKWSGGDQAHQEMLVEGELLLPTGPGFEFGMRPRPPSLSAGESLQVFTAFAERKI